MAYLALARKYRPQNFHEIVGQDFVVKTLSNAIELGRISHAYLFTGPRGVGKTSTARIFAKAVNCKTPDGVNPCNTCEICEEITDGSSMDVIEIDGASNRGIDEIRQLRESVRFIPAKCNYKIYIIDEVHMLTEPAFNALLKTLEEPPEHVIFIMATTDAHRIPPTILSRCQRYDFKKIPADFMYDYLSGVLQKEEIEHDRDAVSVIMRNSEGCMRDALSLVDQIVAYSGGTVNIQDTSYLLGLSDYTIINRLFELVLDEDITAVVKHTEEINLKGLDYIFITKTIIEYLKHIMFAKATGYFPEKELTSEEIKYFTKIMEKIDENRAFVLFQLFQKLLQDLKFYDMQQYVFEFGLYKAANISKVIDASAAASKSAPIPENKTAAKTSDTHGKSTDSKMGLNDTDKMWDKLLDQISKYNPSTSANLSHGYIITSDSNNFKVGFSEAKRFHYDIVNKKEHLDIITNVVRNFFGDDRKLSIVLENGSKKKGLSEKKEELETYHEKKTKEEINKNEMISKIKNEFNGKITNIKVYKANK